MDTQGPTEKSFRYVVQVPSSEGLDMVHVDLKVNTAWLFQDSDGGGAEHGLLLERVASGPSMDTGVFREQLVSSEQELLAAMDKRVVSESGLRSRIRELELSEQRLLRKVDRLSTWAAQERSASLQAQRQLEVLQDELANQVQEQERVARRLRARLRRREEALGWQAAALERGRRTQRRQLGLAREQERELRAQVRRLERDVRRLCRAAGRLLAELDASRAQGQDAAAAARGRQEERATEGRLWAQLEELRCCVFELQLSEIGLQGQVEDLTQQNESLREKLGAEPPGEKAWGTAPAGHCVLNSLGSTQDEFLPPMKEDSLDSSQGQCWPPPLWLDKASGCRTSAELCSLPGQHMEPCCPWGITGAEDEPSTRMPGLESMGILLGDLMGADHEQPALTVHPPNDEILVLVCRHPHGPCGQFPLLPVSLVQHSELSPAVTSVLGSLLLVPTSCLSLQGPSGEVSPLLLLPQIQEELGARPPLAPDARGHPRGDCHLALGHSILYQKSPCIPSPPVPGKELEGQVETFAGSGGGSGWATELWVLGGAPGSPTGQGLGCQEAPEIPASVHGPLQEVTLGPEESPMLPCERGGGRGQSGDLPGGLWPEGVEVVPPVTLSVILPGGQLWTEEGRGGGGGAGRLQQQEEAEEGGLSGAAPSPGPRAALAAHEDEERQEQRWSPSSTGEPQPAEGHGPASGPWAPGTASSLHTLMMAAFQEEGAAGLQQLPALCQGNAGPLGETSTLAGEHRTFDCRPPSREGGALIVVSHAPDVWPEVEEEVVPGNPGGPGQNQGWATLGPGSTGAFQLGEERTEALQDLATLRGDQEGLHRKVGALERDRERLERRVSELQRDNDRLWVATSHLQTEAAQYRQLLSDLEDCNHQSYERLLVLDEEKRALQGALAQAGRAARENMELWVLVSELGAGYQGLVQDVVLGMDAVLAGLRVENDRLLRRVQELEQGLSLESRGQEARLRAVDKAVQAAQLSGHQLARASPLSWEEARGQGSGQSHPLLCAEEPGICVDFPALSSTWGSNLTSRVQEATSGAGAGPTGVDTEESRPRCSGDQGREGRVWCPLCSGPGGGVVAEALRLRVGQLHHQLVTLMCRLRDQGTLHRELHASQEEAARLREGLQDQRRDSQEKLRQAGLVVSPLKAKVSSLVQKCQERNGLITCLLQELQQLGAASQLLTTSAQRMVDDAALAEYTATFLTTGAPELPLPPGQTWDPEGAEDPGNCHADSCPTTCELLSPARILALHQELRGSISSHPRALPSALDMHI